MRIILNYQLLSSFVILTLLPVSCSQDKKQTKAYPHSHKIRVIHTSDLVRDDENTLIRLLLFSNDQKILGIHSSASPWSDTGVIRKVFRHIDLYEKVYPNLIKHDPTYPTPDYLRSITMPGNEIPNDYITDTPGSLHIKDVLLDHSNDEPVWVTCWGGPATVTAALRYINDHYPEEKAYVAKKLRIYFVGRQEGTEDTYQKEQPCMDYINSHYQPLPQMLTCETYNYMNYWGDARYWFNNVQYSTKEWVENNYNKGNGPLCDDFKYYETGDCDGDAPAMLHILGDYYGLRSTEDPSYGGWGSRFSRTVNNDNRFVNWDEKDLKPHYVADAYSGDTITRNWYQKMHYSGARWNDDIQNELAVRASWCVKSYAEANHPPVVYLTSAPDIEAIPGEQIRLSCEASDPDGDSLKYHWWQYKEAGTSMSTITINSAETPEASFICPDDPGKTIHVILEVQDNGKGHPLTRYARVIVNIKPSASELVRSKTTSPVKVILDTDIDSDVDDVGALAMLHAMMSNGEVEILAVMISSTCPYSAACVDAINTYYGRPDIPIGVKKGNGVCRDSHYTGKVAKNFPQDIGSGINAPDAKLLYRQILAGEPDNSVTIISIGYFTNLADLLRTSGDPISKLDGKDLVNKKVIELVSTGGKYPSDLSYQGNGNFEPDGKAVQYVNEHWPTMLTYVSGEKWFWDVQTGAKLMEECDTDKNPIAYAYKEFHSSVDWDYINPEHHSADQIGVFVAVRGFENKYMLNKTSGYFYIWDNGLCEWRDDHDEPLRRVVYSLKEPYSENASKLAEEIETLMMQAPQQENESKILDKKLTDFTLFNGEEYRARKKVFFMDQ